MISDKIWSAHVWMQTVSAYPNGPMPAALCHVHRAVELGLPRNVDKMLVLGPGTENEINALHAAVAPRIIAALTLSADEIDGLRRSCASDVFIGDMHDMPLGNASFDLVFSSNVMEHAIAPHMALLECRRVLREGGTFYAVVPTPDTAGGNVTPWHTYCFDVGHWMALLSKAGLRCETIRRENETLEGGAVESYFHIKAVAVPPPPPHDEVLRRISEGKE